jgi:hypothetical protein
VSLLRSNLALAEYAVSYVQQKMSKGLGPSNRMESVAKRVRLGPMPGVEEGPSPQRGWTEILSGTAWEQQRAQQLKGQQAWKTRLNKAQVDQQSAIRTAVEMQRAEFRPTAAVLYGNGDELERVKAALALADIVKKSKLGNCGEQSCLAFKYLITRGAPGLGIIEWVSGNHTFVVLGMQASVAKESSGSFARAPDWGPDAVVCDPWYHEWFAVSSASDWKTKMKRIAADAQRLSVADVNAKEDTAWRFVRLAYLAHGDPEITRAACGAKPARTSAERNLLPVADRDRRDGVGVR